MSPDSIATQNTDVTTRPSFYFAPTQSTTNRELAKKELARILGREYAAHSPRTKPPALASVKSFDSLQMNNSDYKVSPKRDSLPIFKTKFESPNKASLKKEKDGADFSEFLNISNTP